jgi:hypothetical protein
MEGRDHLSTRKWLCDPEVDVDELGSVLDRVLENSNLFLNTSPELPAARLAAAGRYDRYRKFVPAGLDGILGIGQVIETDFDTVGAG